MKDTVFAYNFCQVGWILKGYKLLKYLRFVSPPPHKNQFSPLGNDTENAQNGGKEVTVFPASAHELQGIHKATVTGEVQRSPQSRHEKGPKTSVLLESRGKLVRVDVCPWSSRSLRSQRPKSWVSQGMMPIHWPSMVALRTALSLLTELRVWAFQVTETVERK